MDETNTSFAMLVILGTTAGVFGGLVATFFGWVLWNNIEEVPDDDEASEEESSEEESSQSS